MGNLIAKGSEAEPQEQNDFITQILNEKKLYDILKRAGLTVTTQDPLSKAISRPEGVISNVNRLEVQWYDRNSESISDYGAIGGACPLAGTLWTYTVPLKRKAYVEIVHAYILLNTIRATVGVANASLMFYKGGVGKVVAQIPTCNNVVGDSFVMNLGQSLLLNEGENVRVVASDTGNGGNVTISSGFKGTEFDA